MRKPTFCICENKDADQLRGNREADQCLCFCHIGSTIPLLSKSEIYYKKLNNTTFSHLAYGMKFLNVTLVACSAFILLDLFYVVTASANTCHISVNPFIVDVYVELLIEM